MMFFHRRKDGILKGGNLNDSWTSVLTETTNRSRYKALSEMTRWPLLFDYYSCCRFLVLYDLVVTSYKLCTAQAMAGVRTWIKNMPAALISCRYYEEQQSRQPTVSRNHSMMYTVIPTSLSKMRPGAPCRVLPRSLPLLVSSPQCHLYQPHLSRQTKVV